LRLMSLELANLARFEASELQLLVRLVLADLATLKFVGLEPY